MKLKFWAVLLLTVMISKYSIGQLQLDNTAEKNTVVASNALGNSFAELVQAIKPNTFSPVFLKTKKQFINSAKLINTPGELAKPLLNLLQSIKAEKLKPGLNKNQYIKSVGTTSTMQSAKEQLLTLEKT